MKVQTYMCSLIEKYIGWCALSIETSNHYWYLYVLLCTFWSNCKGRLYFPVKLQSIMCTFSWNYTSNYICACVLWLKFRTKVQRVSWGNVKKRMKEKDEKMDVNKWVTNLSSSEHKAVHKRVAAVWLEQDFWWKQHDKNTLWTSGPKPTGTPVQRKNMRQNNSKQRNNR